MKLAITYEQQQLIDKLIKDFGHVTTRELLREALIIKLDNMFLIDMDIDSAILLDCLNEKENENV